jgi:pyruvate formate lyase activating enzyme
MMIGGWQKVSLIDYPGKVSCVLFISGCNFRCPYCHNPQLVIEDPLRSFIVDEQTIHDYLNDRKTALGRTKLTY